MRPVTKHRPSIRRNAKPKPKPRRAPLRHRNAAPPIALTPVRRPSAPRSSTPRTKADPSPTKKETLVHLVETLIGAGVTSVVGAYAVKWGLHPELVSAGLGIAGGYTAWQSPSERNRLVAGGAAAAAGSQLLLLKLNPVPTPAAASAASKASPPAAPAASPPAQLRKADLGALPPGVLDAAFERARSELAVAGDGYPAGYEPRPIHHGPVIA